VIFPVRVTPTDRKKPVLLALTVDYAVCEAICLSNRARCGSPAPTGRSSGKRLALRRGVEAGSEKPCRGAGEVARRHRALGAAGGKAQWRLKILAPGASGVFIEAPKGFYVETRPGGAGDWLLTMVEHPPLKAAGGAAARHPFRRRAGRIRPAAAARP